MINHLDNFISIFFFCPSWDTLDSHSIPEPLDKNVLKENNVCLQFWFRLTALPWNNLVLRTFPHLGEGKWQKTSADHMIFKHPEKLHAMNWISFSFLNRWGGAVAVRTMKGILKKNALTADKSLNSVLNSSPPMRCYYYTQFSWVFKNHVISQCQGLFPPAFCLVEKNLRNKVGHGNLLAVFWISTQSLPPSRLNYHFVILSDEGLTLEMPAFWIFHSGNLTFINSFDKTKHLCIAFSFWTRHRKQ